MIHTVGPVWDGGERREAELLASCYRESLRLATEKGLTSIAFPAISAGVYGWSADDVAKIAASTVRTWADAHPTSSVQSVRFVLFSEPLLQAFRRVI